MTIFVVNTLLSIWYILNIIYLYIVNSACITFYKKVTYYYQGLFLTIILAYNSKRIFTKIDIINKSYSRPNTTIFFFIAVLLMSLKNDPQ